MSQSVITSAFEQLKAQEAANGGVVILDEFVFASVPDLNITDPIDRGEGMPDAAQVVHRQAVGKTGMVNGNAVVYSVNMGADVGDFEFNWVGLVNKASGVVAMIVHAPLQKKIKTAAGQQGNVLTRSFLMEYDGASEQTQIIAPADTWQIDFTARLNGVDERARIENRDIYGAASFFGDGFSVSKNGTQYSVARGVGYIAGLRAELLFNQALTVSQLPAKVWADVSWKGTLTSVWGASVKLAVADSLADYVEGDEQHYVTALAEIGADGSIIDLRKSTGLIAEINAKQPLSPTLSAIAALVAGKDTVAFFREKDEVELTSLTKTGRDIIGSESVDDVLQLTGLSDPKKGADVVAGARRVFRVTDYGAKADYNRATRTPVTDSTAAWKKAFEAALKVNGVVHFPGAPQGFGYYITDSMMPIITSGAGRWFGVSITGDGLYASSIYCNCGDKPSLHIKGTSGWPSNIKLQGFSLYAHDKYKGVGLKEQGVCVYEVADVGIYEFDDGVYLSNGDAAGIFTEFVTHNRLWLKDNNTTIKFRRDGGDNSFHGVNFNNTVVNNLPGQTAIDIGEGCVVYNSTFNQLALFGSEGVNFIINNGSRSGFETLWMEGDGTLSNHGPWQTDGKWQFINKTGKLKDTSTVPFMTQSYVTPTTPKDGNFSASGLSTIESMRTPVASEAHRGLLKARGPNAEAVIFTGYEGGAPESQGLVMASQKYGGELDDLVLRYMMHLKGIRSYQQNFALSYGAGAAQVSINSGGRASGVMGRRTAGTIAANSAAQTITTSGIFMPESAHPAHVTLVFRSYDNDVINSAIYVGASSPVGSSKLTLMARPVDLGARSKFTPPEEITIALNGNFTFTFTSTINMTFTMTIVGVGAY